MENTAIPAELATNIVNVKAALGKKIIDNEELLLLAADEIAHSFSRDEINIFGHKV